MKKQSGFVIVFLLLYSLTGFAQNWDIDLLKEINLHREHSLDQPFRIITNYAAPLAYSIPVILWMLSLMRRCRRLQVKSLYLIQSAVLALLLSTIIKHVINRPRPFITYPFIQKITSGGSPSFPSGHSSDAFTLAFALSFVFPKWYVMVPAFLWAIAVGYSRMDLGVHYPSDVLGSMVIAFLSAYLCFLLSKRRKSPNVLKE